MNYLNRDLITFFQGTYHQRNKKDIRSNGSFIFWNLKLLFLFSKWKSQASFWIIQIWLFVLGQEKNILEARSFDLWKSNNTLEATLEDTLAVRNKKNIYIDQSYFDKNEIIHWKQRWKILWLVRRRKIYYFKIIYWKQNTSNVGIETLHTGAEWVPAAKLEKQCKALKQKKECVFCQRELTR